MGLAAGVVMLAGALRPCLAQEPIPASACDVAGAEAEKRFELPSGLLRAIGRVESGRRDPATGRVAAWPWTINAEGRGQSFQTRADALTATKGLRASGIASIDVGCFQVNLVHHPAAFATLEDGFDPRSNADYAARFLVSLRAKTGSWESAIGAYHSSTPERAGPYRDRVMAGWPRDGQEPVVAAVSMPVPAFRVMTWSAAPSPGPMRIWTPSAAGQGASIIRITRG